MEALQKEGTGGDNLAVGWAKPGQSTSAPSEVIPGSVLSPFSGGGQTAGPEINVLGNGTTILAGDRTPAGGSRLCETDFPTGTVTQFTVRGSGWARWTLNLATFVWSDAADPAHHGSPATDSGAGRAALRFAAIRVQWARGADPERRHNDADENLYDSPAGTGSDGTISREVWTGINGTTVASIAAVQGRRQISLIRCRASKRQPTGLITTARVCAGISRHR